MHDSENESHDSYASGKSSQELDGPPRSQREASDSSEFSLPPPPSEPRSNHSGGSNISPSLRSPLNRPPGATNISPSLRSPPKRPPGAGNVFPLPPDVAAIEASVLFQASGQLGDSHIKGFVSRPNEDGSNPLGYVETQQMLQHETGRVFNSPYSANQQQVSRVIPGPPVPTTRLTESQESEVSSPTSDESADNHGHTMTSAVNRSQFSATSNVSSAQSANNHSHIVTSAVSNTTATSDYQPQAYHSAVNQVTNIPQSKISHQVTDKSGKTITVTAGQPTPYQQSNSMKQSEQSTNKDNMQQKSSKPPTNTLCQGHNQSHPSNTTHPACSP